MGQRKIEKYDYLCEICGFLDDDEETVVQCKANHSYCKDHDPTRKDYDLEEVEEALDYETLREKRAVIQKIMSPEEYKKFLKTNREIAMDDPDDAMEACDECLQNIMGDDEDPGTCPICSGEDFSNAEFITYYMKKNNMDRKKVASMIMKEFDSYENFKLYIS